MYLLRPPSANIIVTGQALSASLVEGLMNLKPKPAQAGGLQAKLGPGHHYRRVPCDTCKCLDSIPRRVLDVVHHGGYGSHEIFTLLGSPQWSLYESMPELLLYDVSMLFSLAWPLIRSLGSWSKCPWPRVLCRHDSRDISLQLHHPSCPSHSSDIGLPYILSGNKLAESHSSRSFSLHRTSSLLQVYPSIYHICQCSNLS
ncbi:hypothetical protein C8R44DRAFT_846095, partial [Mycena epipterygia]